MLEYKLCADRAYLFTDVFPEAYNHAGIYLKKNHLWDFPGTVWPKKGKKKKRKLKPTFELRFSAHDLVIPMG